MSRKYKFWDSNRMYFISLASVVGELFDPLLVQAFYWSEVCVGARVQGSRAELAILVPYNKYANNKNIATVAIMLAFTNRNSKHINYLEILTLQSQQTAQGDPAYIPNASPLLQCKSSPVWKGACASRGEVFVLKSIPTTGVKSWKDQWKYLKLSP